jgi:hypothetical protein
MNAGQRWRHPVPRAVHVRVERNGSMSRVTTAVLPIAVMFAAVVLAISPATAWELLSKSEEPHRSYTLFERPHAGSEYSEYRLEVFVESERDQVIAALEHNILDSSTYPEGFRRTLLRRERAALITYDYVDVPILSDRDVVMRIDLARDADPAQPAVRWHAIEGEGPRPPAGVVRMPSYEGTWTLTPTSSGTLAVYQSHVDFGGSVPRALVESRLPAEIAQQAIVLRRTLDELRVAQR